MLCFIKTISSDDWVGMPRHRPRDDLHLPQRMSEIPDISPPYPHIFFLTGPNEANPWPIVHFPHHLDQFDCGEALVTGRSSGDI